MSTAHPVGFRTWKKFGCFALAGTTLLIPAGCGNAGNKASSEDISSPAAPLDPSTSGSITGSVQLDGSPPVLSALDMSAAPACVNANRSPVIPPQVVSGANGALADVAVYIKSGLGNRHFDAPKDPVVLEQKACMYEPRVIALMVNQTMEVRNDDSTTHNIHVVAKTNEGWNKSQPSDGPAIKQSFTQPELAIPIICNVHPWMRAYAFVFSHPYFAVTSKTGTFEIANLPPGTYTVAAWQERYGTQEQTVTIGPKESKAISFVFKSVTPAAADAHVARQ